MIERFNSNNETVENILSEYAPKHPDFFKLVSKLDLNKLTIKQYNKLRLNIERLKLIKDYNSDNFVQLNVPSYIKNNGDLGFHKDVYGYDEIQKLNFSTKENRTKLALINEKKSIIFHLVLILLLYLQLKLESLYIL